MLQTLISTFFVRQPRFKLKPWSVFIFIVLASVAWEINVLGQITFPSQNLVPYFARLLITLIIDLALLYVSFRLLKQNNLPIDALGLSISKKTIPALFWGAIIGSIAMAIIGGLLYLYNPYYFVSGPLGRIQVLKESISYLLGNSLEELMFRGFLFIIFSQLGGWRLSALIMAIPFGLFHLQGTGNGMDALKIIATTALYSFVFSFSYVLLRSM